VVRVRQLGKNAVPLPFAVVIEFRYRKKYGLPRNLYFNDSFEPDKLENGKSRGFGCNLFISDSEF
jgi:hypothetical protein